MEFTHFVLLGLGIGALYALVSQGIVLIYRGSGVVNFAQGALVMVGGYAYYEFRVDAGLPGWVSVVGAIVVGAVLGAAVHLLILRPMRNSSPIERVIATLGVLLTLQAAAILKYGVTVVAVPPSLPSRPISILGQQPIGLDRLLILGLGVMLTVGLFVLYRRSAFGRVASAVAESQRAAASLGHSPDAVATANWALGSALAALAGALIGPITFLQPTALVMLVVPGLAAALIGSFSSFPIAFGGALFIGVAQSLMTRYVSTPGWSDSVPFLLIVIVLTVRGAPLPLRSHVLERLPKVGDGRIRLIPTVIAVLVLAYLINSVVSPVWAQAITVTLAFGVMCLSVLMVTGYAGQLSLAQYVLAGVGAFSAARFSEALHLGFGLSVVLAVLVAVALGVVVALPALRTRGINLAVATLGLGIVIFSLLLNSFKWAGGDSGITVPSPSLLGWHFDSIRYPYRYGLVTLAVFVLAAMFVANIRRGRSGRRMLAVRSNERAAAALGVNVFAAKLYAFGVSAGLAALAGVLLAFQSTNVIADQFDPVTSIMAITVTVVGGAGFIGGAILGGTLLPGGVGTQLLHEADGVERFLPLISGLFLLYVLRSGRDGLWAMNVHTVRLIGKAILRVFWRRTPAERPVAHVEAEPVREPTGQRRVAQDGLSLRVENLTVRFGGVVAVDHLSLDIRPGEVHGLIGPNGAGKTSAIDALTGFVRHSADVMTLGGSSLQRWSPRRRARAGISRSFQSLELFNDLTVRENLAVACDRGRAWSYLSDGIHPGPVVLSEAAHAAVAEFDLTGVLDRRPDELAFGQRRLVAIARAVSSDPRLLLLDEPAAGLSGDEANELAELIALLAHDWGIAVLLVEHNVDLVMSICDRITVLDFGRTISHGTPAQVSADPAVMTAYLGVAVTEGPTLRTAPTASSTAGVRP